MFMKAKQWYHCRLGNSSAAYAVGEDPLTLQVFLAAKMDKASIFGVLYQKGGQFSVSNQIENNDIYILNEDYLQTGLYSPFCVR